VDRVALHAATIPLISTVTGKWMGATEAVDPGYWARHIRAPVRFSEGLRWLLEPSRILLEVGPTSTLTVLARRHAESGPDHSVVASMRRSETESSVEMLLEALGRLWLGGADIDWSAFSARERRRRIPLPTYPFERQRHWIETSNAVGDAGHARIVAEQRVSSDGATRSSTSSTMTIGEQRRDGSQPQTAVEAVVQAVWQDVLGIDQVHLDDNFFDLGGHSLLLTEMAARINRMFRIDLPQYALLEAPTIATLADRIERIYRPA
jgi:acyl transferase domain-containing protein